MQAHSPWAFVLHGQTRAHLDQHLVLPNTEFGISSLASAVLLSRSAHIGVRNFLW